MHSIETLRGFQLQTSHEGTSYQAKIRKNRWTNITWEVSMWQRDSMSYAQHKLQKHYGCSQPLRNLEIFIFRKSVAPRSRCVQDFSAQCCGIAMAEQLKTGGCFRLGKKHDKNLLWHKQKKWRLSWYIFVTSPSNSAISMGRIVCEHIQFILSLFGPETARNQKSSSKRKEHQSTIKAVSNKKFRITWKWN